MPSTVCFLLHFGMALLRIRKYGDAVLRQKSDPVAVIDEEIVQLVDNMLQTLYDAEGVGLAAPQVGASERVIVVDAGHCDPEYKPMGMINPEILLKEGEDIREEGCLSLPEIYGEVERAYKISVRWSNTEGERVEAEAEGLLARVIQHEIDHLDGVLIIDHFTPLKRQLIKNQLRKLKKETYLETSSP